MRVMTRSALKKIADAGGKEGVEASPTKPKAGGKKRKAKDEGDDEEAKMPKKGGKKPKKSASPEKGKDLN